MSFYMWRKYDNTPWWQLVSFYLVRVKLFMEREKIDLSHRVESSLKVSFQSERVQELNYDNILEIFSLKMYPCKVRGAFDSAKNHKRQRRKRQSVTAKQEKSQTPFSSYRSG